ncbi:MAG: sulfatase [Acidobacterium ailaaui]|nr:sulfatase [Pseudacidobacterium ailaaui]
MKRILLKLLISFIFFLLFMNCKKHEKERKPNILILLADQWRGQALGYAGDPNVITPNLDSLASTSAVFINAVSSLPVCTPFKASLITGQRPLTNGVFMNDVMLDTNAITIAKVLDKAGYNTGFIGKWHLDGQYRLRYTPPGPRRQGFQYWKAVNCDHNYFHSVYYFNNDTTRHYWKGYDAIAETQSAIKYIHDHSHDTKPFFLVLSWGPPHSPYHEVPEKYKAMYNPSNIILRPNVPDSIKQRVRYDLCGYYAHISALDDMVGQIVSELKKEGIFDNTIILFTSDHGDLLGSHGKYAKQQPYDESIKVPMLFHFSGKNGIKKGIYRAMISSEDIMPTLLGLSGVKIPRTVEGIDFSRYLRKKEKDPKDTVALITCVQPFGEWDRARGGKEYRGIRTPNYTYVRDLKGPWLLFDDQNDPYQMNNLVNKAEYAGIQSHLDHILIEKLNFTHDQFLPGPVYVKKYHYPPLDSTGTVPYYYDGKWHL